MKYCKELVDEICDLIRRGASNDKAITSVGIGERTFYQWQKEKAEFAEAIKKAQNDGRKTIVNRLENALYKRALGYDAEESEVEYTSDANGNPRIKYQKKKKKHIAPDVGALVFALTNLDPENWKNKMVKDSTIRGEISASAKPEFDISAIPDEELFKIADILQKDKQRRKEKERNGAKSKAIR